MALGAYQKGVIPLMRDGSQWRPFVHVQDTTDVMCLLLEADPQIINGEIYNVGSDSNNYQLGNLAQEITEVIPKPVTIAWYGAPDHRSYRVSFDKIEKALGWQGKWTAAQGALEIYNALAAGEVPSMDQTITLDWYSELIKWHKIIKDATLYGGILDIQGSSE